ncbi:Peptide transporter PTR1 [Sesbania bispinosa]|nr:Peptide transporter PTR1 [Sesbania bispinosa]
MGSTFLLFLVGGFISDTYLNRLTTCLVFGSLEGLALIMLTVQASSNHLHPDACGKSSCGKSSCVKGGIAVIGFVILALGKPFYRIKTPSESPILRIDQVIVVAFKTIKLLLPRSHEELYEIYTEEKDCTH